MAEELWNTVLKEIGEHLGESAGILLVIISAAYLSSIFTATADLESSGNHDVVSFAVICLISVPVIANIGEVVAQAGDTISEIRTVMLSSIPGLCAMDMGSSAAGAAGFYYHYPARRNPALEDFPAGGRCIRRGGDLWIRYGALQS